MMDASSMDDFAMELESLARLKFVRADNAS